MTGIKSYLSYCLLQFPSSSVRGIRPVPGGERSPSVEGRDGSYDSTTLDSSLRRNVTTLPKILLAAALILILCGLGALSAQDSRPSVNLPVNHFAVDFFERLETKGTIAPSIEFRNRPYTRHAVHGRILALDSLLIEQPDALTATEKELLAKLKGEFHVELASSKVSIPEEEVERHLVFWRTERTQDSYVIGDALFDQNIEITRMPSSEDSLNETISNTTARGAVRGLIKSGLAFYSDFTTTMIKGSDVKGSNYQPTRQGILTKTNNVYSLEANAYVVIEPRWFRLQFGKEKLVLGPGKRNVLFLSDNAPAFDNLRMDVTFDRIKYTYFHGFLRSPYLAVNTRGDTSDRKYIAGHRLELKVLPWLFIAGNESVVYGGRALETQYLNPIMIYHVAEQYAGDKDNNTLSIDATAFAGRGVKAYAALFLDDYRLADNPFTYWKQQWSLLAGIFWADPVGLEDTDVRMEYTRVEPFVYTHKFGLINYTHFEQSLGTALPPNSDAVLFEGRYQPSRRHAFRTSYEFIRHGDGDVAVSGEELGYGQPGRMKKKFLMGVNETRHVVSLGATWEVFRNHYAYADYSFQHVRNFENVRGRDISQHFALIGYRLDY